MKYAIWGAGKIGQWLKVAIERTRNQEAIEIIGFGDNNEALIGQKKDGLNIFSLKDIQKLYKTKEIDAVIIATQNQHVAEIAEQLVSNDILELYLLPYYIPGNRKLYELNISSLLVKIDGRKPRLEYFEYHVCDHCNLNCKGCGHLCPLVKEPAFGDLDAYEKDLKRLKELVWGVKRIRLMGGEPLLNPRLKEFVQITRSVFKDAMLKVVTNGLLIDKVDEDLFETMRENDCEFDISLYKPTAKMKHRIEAICNLYGVNYNMSPLIMKFYKHKDISGKQNMQSSYASCGSKNCAFLRNGKISSCAAPQITTVFNNSFGTNITSGENDIVDLYDVNLNGRKLIENLSSPMEICRFCTKEVQPFEWNIAACKSEMNDWIANI